MWGRKISRWEFMDSEEEKGAEGERGLGGAC